MFVFGLPENYPNRPLSRVGHVIFLGRRVPNGVGLLVPYELHYYSSWRQNSNIIHTCSVYSISRKGSMVMLHPLRMANCK
jgi:hypothetical protein